MTIGQRISEKRKERGYSQEYVAEMLNVSRQAVSKWECDTSAPDTYNLIALAELLGVSVEYIALGKKESEPTIAAQENTNRNVTVINHNRQSLGLSNILGILFLTCGIICGIMAVVLDEEGLLPLSLSFLVCATFSFLQVKHKPLVVAWGYWLYDLLLGMFGMTPGPFLIFNPAYYGGGFSWNLISGYITWIWLAANIVYTVYYVKKFKEVKRKYAEGTEKA